MGALDFWHPVLTSQELSTGRAVGVKLAGHSLAVFRAGPGQLGAVDDQCPHRRMRLSIGTVKDGKLTCAYHGWSFTCDGNGESPGTPKLQACVGNYDCQEAHGAIWIKRRGAERPLPALPFDDYVPVGVVVQRVPAPLQLVIDNFSEVEHTVATHSFGIDPARAHEAVVAFEPSDTAITVRNTAPAKAPDFLARCFLLFRRRFLFHSDYTLTFEPPLSAVEHRWSDPLTGREAMIKYRLYHFFVPEDDHSTRLVTFGGVHSRWPVGPGGGIRAMRWYMRKMIQATVDEDIWLLQNMADPRTDLEGMKLSRFDRVLGMTRDRLRRLYYGTDPTTPPAEAARTDS